MLSKAKTLKGYKLDSLDGEIGKVKEFYFDDRHWTIRYLVAETGTWLADRQVLISPYALVAVNKEEQNIAVDLTKKQIEDSPSLDSRQARLPPIRTGLLRALWIPDVLGRPVQCGDIIPTRCVTVNNGKNPPRRERRGIPICAALTV